MTGPRRQAQAWLRQQPRDNLRQRFVQSARRHPVAGERDRHRFIHPERLAQQQIAGSMVGDGQRIAVLFIAEPELAFVIGAPEIVWAQALRQRRTFGSVP